MIYIAFCVYSFTGSPIPIRVLLTSAFALLLDKVVFIINAL